MTTRSVHWLGRLTIGSNYNCLLSYQSYAVILQPLLYPTTDTGVTVKAKVKQNDWTYMKRTGPRFYGYLRLRIKISLYGEGQYL